MKEYYLPYHYYAVEEWEYLYYKAFYTDEWTLTDDEWDYYCDYFYCGPYTDVIDDSYFEDDETYFDNLD